MTVMNGALLRDKILNDLRKTTDSMVQKPKLVAVLVGDDRASQIYVRNKQKYAAIAGIQTDVIHMPTTVDTATVIDKLHQLNSDDTVSAILVQLPLPKHIDTHAVINAVALSKDVDGFTDANLAQMYGSSGSFVTPCTTRGILSILNEYNIDVANKNVVVIGRSNIVGLPTAHALLARNATVTICHSHTKNIADYTRMADIVISATGRINITGDMLKSGCVLIDVGIQYDKNGKMRGDCDFESCLNTTGFITPTPGGIGPMTIAGLMMNTIDLFQESNR